MYRRIIVCTEFSTIQDLQVSTENFRMYPMKIKRGLLYKDTYTCLSSVGNKIKVVILGANVNEIPLENQTALQLKELLTCIGIPDSKDIAVKGFQHGKWRLLLSNTA